MSIKIGFKDYNLNNINNNNNNLTINTHNDSNTILLNNDIDSYSNVLINFKNNYSIGLYSCNFIIYDNILNSNIISINRESNKFFISPDINLNNLILTNKDNIYLNNNIAINFKETSNIFSILNHNNKSLLNISNNDFIYNIIDNSNSFKIINNISNLDIININNSNIEINNDIFIKNKTLYVNNITNYDGEKLILKNVLYDTAIIDTFKINKTLNISNINNCNVVPLNIYKNNNTSNFLEFYTNNNLYSKIVINNDGYIGINKKTPTSIIDINNIYNNNIFTFQNSNIGDTIIITNHGNFGIGTYNPKGHIHIRRNDDLINNDIRKYPLLNLDYNYNIQSNYNYITSNYTTSFNVSNFLIKNLQNIDNTDLNNIKVYNSNIILNNDMFKIISSNISNYSNLVYDNNILFTTPINNDGSNYNFNIIYPNIFKINYTNSEYINNIQNNLIIHRYYIDIMDNNTDGYNTNTELPNYNANDFGIFSSSNIIKTGVICEIVYNIQKIIYNLDYSTLYINLIPSPNIYTITSNNNFISSLSSYGTLSLGTEVPNNYNNYLLYATGNVYLDNIKTNIITSINNSNISLSMNNIIDINNIRSSSNISYYNNSYDNYSSNIYSSNIYSSNIITNSLISSNFSFYSLKNNYISANLNNIHINTIFTVGKTSNIIDNSSIMKVSINSNINISASSVAIHFKHRCGIIVDNDILDNPDSSNNPAIKIKTSTNTLKPYLLFDNNSSLYIYRTINKNFNNNINENSDIFELCCDNYIYDNINRSTYNPLKNLHFFQHIKKYNLLTFGETNNICIDCFNRKSVEPKKIITNYTSKISIGIPYDYLTSSSIGIDYDVDFPYFFHNEINQDINKYMLNIFGNVKIANIKNESLFTIQSENNSTYSAINGEPDNINTLKIYGNCSITSNLNTSNIITSNLTIYKDNSYIDIIEYIKTLENRIITLETSSNP